MTTVSPELEATGRRPRRRTRKRRQRRGGAAWRGEGLSQTLLLGALAGSALGIGAVHVPVLVGCAALAVASAFVALASTRRSAVTYWPVLVPCLLAFYTLLQVVPLPMGLLHALAPHNADVWAHVLEPFREGPRRWATLSLDPGASLVEALKWLTYAAVLVSAIEAGARRGVAWGVHAVFLVAIAVGTITLAHGLAGASRVYGFYAPSFQAARWRVGPLLNPNNLSGYLNVGLLCGTGALLSRKPQLPRIALGIGVAILLAVVLISASRAGLVATLCGMLLLFWLVRDIRKRSETSGRDALLVRTMLAVIAGAVLLAWLGATRETTHALFDKNVEKLEVLARTTPLLIDHPWFGVGRGAFESVFPAYHAGTGNVVYSHPENFAVQWIAEWGFPVGIAALLALGTIVPPTHLGADRSVTAAALWAALMALLLQNLLDLAFEVPAVAILVAFCIGTAWGDTARDAVGSAEPAALRSVPPDWWRWAGLVSAVALGALVLVLGRDGVGKDRLRVRAAAQRTDFADPESIAAVRSELRVASLRHPAEPYFPRIGGLIAWRAGDESPLPWVRLALERGPRIGSTHLELARVLGSFGARNQALFELRLAATYQPDLFRRVAPLASLFARDYDEVLRAVPDGPTGAAVLVAIGVSNRAEAAGDTRERCLIEAIHRDPDRLDARSTLAMDLVRALSGTRAPAKCDGELRPICISTIQDQVTEIMKRKPGSPAAVEITGELWMVTGRARDAESMLRSECPKLEPADREACFRTRVRAAAASGSAQLLLNAAQDLASTGCAAGAHCGELFAWIGRSCEQVGEWSHALAYYQRAVTEDGRDSHWADVARAASALGDHGLATSALERIASRHPADASLRDELASQQRLLLPTMLRR